MAEIGAIRRAVATLWDGHPDITAYAYRPMSPPSALPAVVVLPRSAEFGTGMQARRGQDVHEMELLVLVHFGDAEVAQADLDELISETGPVRSAVAAAPHLGLGTGTTAWVSGLADYGVDYGEQVEQSVLGAVLTLTVRTSR